MFSFRAKIIKGLGIGKKLGFPTINLLLKSVPSELQFGVYAVKCKIGKSVFAGVAHYGSRSFHKAPVSFEIHCFGLNKKVYGKWAQVEILKRLRGARKFKTEAALKRQIERDVAQVRK